MALDRLRVRRATPEKATAKAEMRASGKALKARMTRMRSRLMKAVTKEDLTLIPVTKEHLILIPTRRARALRVVAEKRRQRAAKGRKVARARRARRVERVERVERAEREHLTASPRGRSAMGATTTVTERSTKTIRT